MGANSKIEWTDHTFNPWRGCSKVHTGCLNCYAEKNYSVKMHGVKWGPNGTRVKTANWEEPRKWNRQAECCCRKGPLDPQHEAGCPQRNRPRVFCASLADVFEDWQGPVLSHTGCTLWRCDLCDKTLDGALPHIQVRGPACCGALTRPLTIEDLRRDAFRLIDATPNLDWLLLTKRPENVRRMWCSHVNTDGMPPSQLYRRNVWLGCSISDQPTADAMIPELLQLRGLCAGLFVSAEPLLGPVDFRRIQGSDGWAIDALRGVYSLHHDEGVDHPAALEEHDGGPKLDQVIVGGESGPHARPCNLSWVRLIRDQCKAAGVPCFVKQLGSRPIEGGDFAAKTGPVCSVQLHDKKGGDWDEWPEDLRVRELPEVKGPLLAEKNEGFT